MPPVRAFLKTQKHFPLEGFMLTNIESKSHFRPALFSSPFKEIPWVIINDKHSVCLIKLEKNNTCVYNVCFWKKENWRASFLA